MVDLVRIHIKAGKGGDGRISFFSNRRTLKGGPDGGDGGNGGSVIATATYHENTLRDFSGISILAADSGYMGGAQNMHGKDAGDLHIQLPVGTRIWRVEGSHIPNTPKRMYRNDRDLGRVERPIERRASSLIQNKDGVYSLIEDPVGAIWEDPLAGRTQAQIGDVMTIAYRGEKLAARLVADLTQNDQRVVVARGGRGGRGNETFKSSRNTTPIEAQTGEGGEEGDYIFELQLLADVGLVGLPNAGKSTLLSVLTKATPKIANYPFTTLEPNLGVMTINATHKEDRGSLVIADIPGLIEGASEGKGLGHEFLRHVSRCKTLVFLLTLDDAATLELQEDVREFASMIRTQYQTLEDELATYAKEHGVADDMKEKRRMLLLSKADLVSPENRQAILDVLTTNFPHIRWVSSATGEGIETFKKALWEYSDLPHSLATT